MTISRQFDIGSAIGLAVGMPLAAAIYGGLGWLWFGGTGLAVGLLIAAVCSRFGYVQAMHLRRVIRQIETQQADFSRSLEADRAALEQMLRRPF